MIPKVSVSLTTYNHEAYVARAIDSALMQETTFDYEIVIGEDDSSDRTREIVQGYHENHPDKIRLFLNNRANVIYIDGKPTGRWNLVNNLSQARGRYVAWLDGDDYWTAPDKLQRQADFLDSRPDCALCFHAVSRCYEDQGGRLEPWRPSPVRQTYTINDLFEHNFVPSCSVMFRNGLFSGFPDWYFKVPVGDWPLHILNAEHGDIGYLDEDLAVYRIHGGGLRSLTDSVYRLCASVTLLEAVKQHLGSEYQPSVNDSLARRRLQLAVALVRTGDYRGALASLVQLWSYGDMSRQSAAKAMAWSFSRSAGAARRRLGAAMKANSESRSVAKDT